MNGAGSAPVGAVPAGGGTLVKAQENAGQALVDSSGTQQSARLVNVTSGQYVLDEFGRFVGMSTVAQRVQLALTTKSGTSSVFALGVDTPGGVIGANFVSRRRASIFQALAPLVKDGSIEVIDVSVDASVRPIYTLVRWRDLTTQKEQQTRV